MSVLAHTVCVMALAYAFIDEDGTRYGDENPASPQREFLYVPSSGPFAERQLTIHASSWEGGCERDVAACVGSLGLFRDDRC